MRIPPGAIPMIVVWLACALPLAAQPQGAVPGDVSAQIGPTGPRDIRTGIAAGTARIRGRVSDRDSGRPLRRAMVRLSAADIRETRAATTDQNGAYEFAELPAGQYTLSATRSGYVSGGYRQPRTGTLPTPVIITERETREGVDIALAPGGVIAGRVLDEFGDAIDGAFVTAQRLQYIAGVRRPLNAAPPSQANDLGEFRLAGLPPGTYYVSATPRAQIGSPYEVSADRVGYGQTWYPSAADLSSAQPVTVRAGDTVSGIVISLTPTRTARVSGTVIGVDGAPVRNGMVVVAPRIGFGFGNNTGMVRPDGTFTIVGIAPGDYTFRASIPLAGADPTRGVAMSTANVVISGADVAGLVLQPQIPAPISGRIVGDPATLARLDPPRIRLSMAPVGPVMMSGPVPPPPAIGQDLSFQTTWFQGTAAIRLNLPADVVISSVRLDGRDVTRGFEISSSGVNGLEVEVTASTAKLVAAITSARGEPQADRQLVVFADDESRWGDGMPGHSALGRTNDEGRYETPMLLAGSYYVALADELEPGDGNDPEILATLRTRAQRVTLSQGETATVELRTPDR